MIQTPICPICSQEALLFTSDNLRSYYRCDCDLIFVNRDQLITQSEEKSRYLNHENNEADTRYRNYLEKTVNIITPFLGERKYGLDFGCGASILLEKLFEERGFEVDSYDIYFHPSEEIWSKKYDFIVLSEVIEHLRDPLLELTKLRRLLHPGGMIFIKTMYHPGEKGLFEDWFYKRDPTHIQFFSEASMKNLASQLGLRGGYTTDLKDLTYIMD